MNTFGKLFTLTTFGESHGAAVGGIVDGMPAGITIDTDFIQRELARRRPGQSHITTDRKEADQVELLSGVFEGKSTGAPIGFLVRNTNHHSKDYDNIRDISVLLMRTILITRSMVFVTTEEGVVLQHVSPFHVS